MPLRTWLALGAMAMLQFLVAVDVTVVNVALPSIRDEFGVTTQQLTWVVVAYTVAGGGLLVLGGRLGDMLGRRRVLLTGAALFGGASALAGGAPSFELLIAARLLQGAGEALALPAAMATIVLLFPEGAERSRALGIWAAVASSGLVLGFVLSGVIVELLGWRWIFLVNLPLLVPVLIAVLVLVPADRSAERGPLDLPGALLLLAAPLLLIAGVNGLGEHGLAPVAIVVAVAAAGLLVRVEGRAERPIVPLALLRQPARLRANLATALLSGGLSTAFLLMTLYLQERAGLTPLQTGFALVPLAIALLAVVAVVGRVIERFGVRAGAMGGIAVTALGIAGVALVAGTDAGALALLPAMALVGGGMGLGLVALQSAAVTGATEEDAGLASGMQRASDQLGGSVGVAVYIGVGFSAALAAAEPLVLSGVLAIAGLGLAAALGRRLHEPAPG